MIRIAITEAAFDAIPATLPLGSVAYEPATDAKGDVQRIWLDDRQPESSTACAVPRRATATSSSDWCRSRRG